MSDERFPDDLLYHDAHDWARVSGDQAEFGITWYGQDALGEVVFFEPPALGTSVAKDQPYAEIESVKAVSEVIAPLSGEVVDVNGTLEDSPAILNEDPYGAGWLVKVRLRDPAETGALLDAHAYRGSLE